MKHSTLMDTDDLEPIIKPKEIDFDIAATLMTKGLTTFYLLHKTYPVKKGETVSKSDVNRLLGNIKSFEEKKTKGRIDFIKKSGDILDSNQQIKLLMFEPTVKQQIQKRMKESYRPPMRGGKQKGKRRF